MKISKDISKTIYDMSKNTSVILTNQQIADKYGITEGLVRYHIRKWERTFHSIAKNNAKVNAAVANNTLDVIQESLMIISNIKAEIRDARAHGGDPARMGGLYAQWVKSLQLAAELLGKIDRSPVMNVQLNQEFTELKAVVVGALCPACRASVVSRLKGQA